MSGDMQVSDFLNHIQSSPFYEEQIVHVREVQRREAHYAETEKPLPEHIERMLVARGIQRLYSHQSEAIDAVRGGENVLTVTATASGKTLSYVIPSLEMLAEHPEHRALMLFPTKALCQDQFQGFNRALDAAGMDDVYAGVYDGDTPSHLRRRLRDEASVVFSNPDMIHAAMMPSHPRWAEFLSNLELLVLDEIHVYNGIFGSNMANLMRRFWRVCEHYGADPQVVMCSATISNPKQLAQRLIGREVTVIDEDGSPRGKRTYVLWNPPRFRDTDWHSRKSANVEAHELMAELLKQNFPTITFSKAKMTAEMIYRYVCEKLDEEAPHLKGKVSPYRGGYLAEERREIEKQLFSGELMGVSTTRALELGIDVGGLDASILVGYPGTLASFFQQSGRAGRRSRDALVILIGLDTAINQYIMTHPEYLFGRPIEEAVIDEDNPYIVTGHLRCAAHELPLKDEEADIFGEHARTALRILEENRKLTCIDGTWYHATEETPQHEVGLRAMVDATVTIEEEQTGEVLGEINELDAHPILHPGAIYMHRGDTYRVIELDLEEKKLATVRRVDSDYYTQPIGGEDVHHIDNRLREKPFGTGKAYWGEVTAYSRTWAYEKIHFYSLDPISMHRVDLPRVKLETMAFWIVPPEPLMEKVRAAGLDAHSGLRGIGYATRMMLPLFITCDTLDFSHSIGSANSPWNAMFVYEHYPRGLGFTETAYERLDEMMPAILQRIKECPCAEGCPCCVGKPLRQYATWNVELHEGNVPSKEAAIMILEGLLDEDAQLDQPDTAAMTDDQSGKDTQVERNIRRRLERMREPDVFHRIEPNVETEYPDIEEPENLDEPDVSVRKSRRRNFQNDLQRRLAKRIRDAKLDPHVGHKQPPEGMKRGPDVPPTHFRGRPDIAHEEADSIQDHSPQSKKDQDTIEHGDSLAARARRLKKKRDDDHDSD